MLSIDHPHPELEQWVIDRFEMLNGRHVHLVRKADLPDAARAVHPSYVKAWLWDLVPIDTQRILYMDYDVVPLRSLPEIPDAPFVAAPDAQEYVDRRAVEYPLIAMTGRYFNAGLFVARRDTRPLFEQLKAFAVERTVPDMSRGEFDQTPLNLLTQSTISITWLPHTCNTIALNAEPEMAATAITMHLCGLSMDTRWVVMNVLRTALGMTKLA
jgi:hypothetical protein